MVKGDIEIGDRAKDTITGFSGIVVARTAWLYNCDRLTIQPEKLKDGSVVDDQPFDADQCELIKKAVVPCTGTIDSTFGNGDVVESSLSGFKGLVIATTNWLHNPTSYVVQPQVLDKEGNMAKGHTFHAAQLKMVKKAAHVVTRADPAKAEKKPGGPMPKVSRF